MCELVIGDPRGERILVRVLARERPNCHDEWDGNWLLSQIEVAVGRLSGRVNAYLTAPDFDRFRKEIGDLHAGASETAEFSTMEEQLGFRIAAEERGELRLAGHLSDTAGGRHGSGNCLEFGFRLERSCLPGILTSLDRIIEKFPTRGVGR